ncbi:MAG: hypothetical protein FMNOHCHN_03507 [Ignavibacteriaceae bacterium]|nr:hypothetical protein [Ignavibacteriaceae bacterium]
MNRNFTGYLLFKKDNSCSSKYTKISEAGEIPKSLSADILYLHDRESKVTKNLVRKMKGEYLLKSNDKVFQTSLYLWNEGSFTLLASGDIFRTQTLLIVYFTPGVQIEIFVAPGMKEMRSDIMLQVIKGKHSEELESLRNSAALKVENDVNIPSPETRKQSREKQRGRGGKTHSL